MPEYRPKSTYARRIVNFSNPAAQELLRCIERKRSNLCVSVDVTTKEEVLAIVEAAGPHVCLVKTHADIISDFDEEFIQTLLEFSRRHDFLIFEDRKFADIGNTVTLQYSQGVHKISSWAHITNAHAVPGPSVVTGLSSVGLRLGRGLLLLAEMSSQGNLATGDYTSQALQMAHQHRDFVVGFIAMKRPGISEDFLVLTPGVGLDVKGDGKGQQYRTPREVIFDSLCDVIIVGRGIYGNGADAEEIARQAQRYQLDGWKWYEERISEE